MKKAIGRLFGSLRLTWTHLIIFAVTAGVYTGVMATLPFVRGTSFHDIAMSFEWWVFFGVIIIVNSASAIDAARKCFVFFLISQPLVYLVQAPFHPEGLGLFRYYPGWFVWTLLTAPMGFIGYQLKKEQWWSLLILTPVMLFVGLHYESFLSALLSTFPRRLLSTLFCAALLIICPLCIFQRRALKKAGLIISLIILLAMTAIGLADRKEFYSTSLMSSGSHGVTFDESCTARLADAEMGRAFIEYDDKLGVCLLSAEFFRDGETELIIEGPDGLSATFALIVENSSYRLIPQ